MIRPRQRNLLVRAFLNFNQFVANNNILKLILFFMAITAIYVAVGAVLSVIFGSYLYPIIALVLGIVQNIAVYYFSDKIIIWLTGAKKVSADNPMTSQYSYLNDMINNLVAESNKQNSGLKLKAPEVYIVADPTTVNAFATGRIGKEIICFYTGLLNEFGGNTEKGQRLTKGVAAHELGHVIAHDCLTMTVVSVTLDILEVMLNYGFRHAMNNIARNDDISGAAKLGIMIFSAVAYVFFVPLAKILTLCFVSRTREYAADKAGALLCGDTKPLAEGLGIIQCAHSHKSDSCATERSRTEAMVGTMGIANLTESKPTFWEKLGTWFSTHPRTPDRIARLAGLQIEMDRKAVATTRNVPTAGEAESAQPQHCGWGWGFRRLFGNSQHATMASQPNQANRASPQLV